MVTSLSYILPQKSGVVQRLSNEEPRFMIAADRRWSGLGIDIPPTHVIQHGPMFSSLLTSRFVAKRDNDNFKRQQLRHSGLPTAKMRVVEVIIDVCQIARPFLTDSDLNRDLNPMLCEQ